jgi:5-methylcytosine-specific restriction endonuclease McrA
MHTYCYKCRTKREEQIERDNSRIRSKAHRIKKKLISERGNFCEQCNAFLEELHGHHIVPLRLGGPNEASNIRLLCINCHAKAHPNGTRY